MTVAELIEKLKEMPQEMEVYCSSDSATWIPIPFVTDIAKNKGDSWDHQNIFETIYPDPRWYDTKKVVLL